MELDELFSVRNSFWLGNYELAVEEAQQLSPATERERIDRDVFVYRSFVAQGQGAKVLEAVGDQASAATDVLAVKLLASFVTQPGNQEAVLGTFTEWLSDETSRDNQMLQLMAATAFFKGGDTKEALRSLRATGNLEIHALKVQIYISMNRLDLAMKELQMMQKLDDDSTLSQLSAARLYLASGGEKYQEAAYIFQEQIDKTMASALLLNGLGVSYMHMKKFGEAQKYLEEARQKCPDDIDVLVNLVTCYTNQRKPRATVDPVLAALRQQAPQHPILAHLDACVQTFDRVAKSHPIPA